MIFTLRTRRFNVVVLGATILAGSAAATLAANPAVAAGIVSAVTTVSCSVTGANWCISGNNSSSGIGVIGTSKSGTGLRGTSTSQYGLKATSGSGTAILAQTTSGASAIAATGPAYGVAASANVGVLGVSNTSNGTGIIGESGGTGTGVAGRSESGTGVSGIVSTGTGGAFESDSGYGVTVNTGVGALQGPTTAVVARSENGNGADVTGRYIALIGRAPANGYPLALNDVDGGGVFNVDGQGNVFYTGTLTHVSPAVGGGAARSFGPNSTQPTVEDTGTAQLVGGAAVVRLDSAFAASIEPNAAYRVFVTPDGDTNGLYVAAKTAGGFIVREIHGGRSTVTFDYRIVASALGASGRHMAILSPAAARALALSVPRPIVPAVKIPARPPMPAVAPATP